MISALLCKPFSQFSGMKPIDYNDIKKSRTYRICSPHTFIGIKKISKHAAYSLRGKKISLPAHYLLSYTPVFKQEKKNKKR